MQQAKILKIKTTKTVKRGGKNKTKKKKNTHTKKFINLSFRGVDSHTRGLSVIWEITQISCQTN